MTKYQDIEEPAENVPTAVSPFPLQFVTRQDEHDNLSWLYDTPGLYSKNQVHSMSSNKHLSDMDITSL